MLLIPEHSLLTQIEIWCKKNNLDYFDGIVSFCEINQLEIEVVAELIKKDPIFIAKLQNEAESLNFIKKTKKAKLPW